MLTPQHMARALGGHVSGNQILAPGPGHSPRDRSLSVRITDANSFLVHSFAGDDPTACREYVRERLGLAPFAANASRRLEGRGQRHDPRRSKNAVALFHASDSAKGTLVETYLASRGLYGPPPERIRFHANLKHRSGATWPAMVALISHALDDAPMGIHRTFLARDGLGKAQAEPQRMMLGPSRGGVVRLAEATEILMIGEGIETCLAAMLVKGHPAWAALSTSGLKTLELPKEVRDVIILADGDDAGKSAALAAARRWASQGRRVRIARAPNGMDFNDLLLADTADGGGRHVGS